MASDTAQEVNPEPALDCAGSGRAILIALILGMVMLLFGNSDLSELFCLNQHCFFPSIGGLPPRVRYCTLPYGKVKHLVQKFFCVGHPVDK